MKASGRSLAAVFTVAATLPAHVLLMLSGGIAALVLLVYIGIALPAVWSAKPAPPQGRRRGAPPDPQRLHRQGTPVNAATRTSRRPHHSSRAVPIRGVEGAPRLERNGWARDASAQPLTTSATLSRANYPNQPTTRDLSQRKPSLTEAWATTQ